MKRGTGEEEGQQLGLTLWVSVSGAACLRAELEAIGEEKVGTPTSKECSCERYGTRKNSTSQATRRKETVLEN